MKASMCALSCSIELKEAPCRDFPSRIENQISTWLSHEARVGGEMEVNVGVALEPTIGLGLVRVEVVEDDMNGCVRISGDDIVHEVEEFDAPSALLVSGD